MKQCKECDKTFSSMYSLRRHVKMTHNCDAAEKLRKYKLKDNYKFTCDSCGKNFTHKHHYNHHLKKHEVGDGHAKKDNGSKKCPLCEFHSSFTKNLTDHFEQFHNITIKKSNMEFLTLAEVNNYKSKIENDTRSCFVKKWTTSERTSYVCNRSGTYTAKDVRKRNMKAQGTNKINGFCPAAFVVKTNEMGYFSCEFTETHVGHSNDLGHLSLKNSERKIIAEKIASETPFEVILNDFRNPVFDSNYNLEIRRHNLITKKDLHNIKKSYSVDTGKHESWIKEMNETDKCVVFSKLQNALSNEFPELRADDFVLIIMNSAQSDILQKYGTDCICLDRTHETNDYNYELITLVVLDDLRQGFPCAFMVTSRTDKETLKVFFSSIKKYTDSIRPKVFMTDIDDSFYEAWFEVMEPPTLRLFCSWHIDRDWRENITNIENKEKQVSVYQQLRSTMEERDESSLTSMLGELCSQLLADPDTTEFGAYFIGTFMNNYQTWAYCHQLDAGINSNMNLERLHKTFKLLYLNGTSTKRLDKAVTGIMKFIREQLSYRTSPNYKEKIASKIEDIRSRHKKSLKLSTDLIVTTEKGWEVMSTSPDDSEMYVIKENNKSCECRLVCSACEVCLHRFLCSCPASARKGLMCEHIHLLGRKNNIRDEESIIMIVDGDSEEMNEDSEEISEYSEEIKQDSEEISDYGEEFTEDIVDISEDSEDNEQVKQEIGKIKNEFLDTLISVESVEELKIVKKTLASLNSKLQAFRNSQQDNYFRREFHNKNTKRKRRFYNAERNEGA